MTRFQVLGEVAIDGTPLVARHGRALVALSLLLLNANRVVPTDVLIDAIWGERLPRKPNAALQTYVYRLRPTLPRDVLITRRLNGYVLEVAP